jgi:hypothetical protein
VVHDQANHLLHKIMNHSVCSIQSIFVIPRFSSLLCHIWLLGRANLIVQNRSPFIRLRQTSDKMHVRFLPAYPPSDENPESLFVLTNILTPSNLAHPRSNDNTATARGEFPGRSILFNWCQLMRPCQGYPICTQCTAVLKYYLRDDGTPVL